MASSLTLDNAGKRQSNNGHAEVERAVDLHWVSQMNVDFPRAGQYLANVDLETVSVRHLSAS